MDPLHLLALGLFLVFVLVMLAFDLLILHRKPHAIHFREALIGSAVPVVAAGCFALLLYFSYGHHWFHLGDATGATRGTITSGSEASLLFATGYLVELSLSADNVFLFVVLMGYFKVPRELQHRVLFWGVLGALVMRGIMIGAAAYLTRFEWVIYTFGLFLLFTGIKMFFSGDEPKDPSDNIAVRLIRKKLPFHDGFDGQKFFTVRNGRRMATTLLLVLICIEFTDLVFALDSIPAIFGITTDWFIVFTSNVFAILGLRSMYFLLAGVMDKFHLLKYGLAAVLAFVGVKMILPGAAELVGHFQGRDLHWEIDKLVSLVVIVLLLTVSVVASLLFPSRKHHVNPTEDPVAPSPGIEARG